MPFDLGKTRESSFMSDFDGEVVEAGFLEGFLPGDKTRSGKPIATRQIFLLWRPLDQGDVADQPEWYSMGGKDFVFGGEPKQITIGTKDIDLFPTVAEGPELQDNSKAGKLVIRLNELGYPISGGDARVFMGLRAHLIREQYDPGDRSTIDAGSRGTLMPVAILEAKRTKVTKAATLEVEEVDVAEVLVSLIVGKTDKDMPEIAKNDRVKSLGLNLAKLFTACDKLLKEGKMKRSEGGVYEVA